jgi:hypothetical protein
MNHAKRNWTEYNKSLVNKGSLTVWIDPSTYAQWIYKSGKRGRPKFSSYVIKVGWILKTVYRLTFRALQGFFNSILQLMKLPMKAPDYSLFSKRADEVLDDLPRLSTRRPTDLVIDASGFKVYGEGEWKVKIHGKDKPRRWIKAHIAIDPKSQEVIGLEVTENTIGDAPMLPKLIEKAPKSVSRVTADGAYDKFKCRKLLREKGILGIIPPPTNARMREGDEFIDRNDALKIIGYFGGDGVGRSIWKKLIGYHQRSLVETAFSSLKRLFGDRLQGKIMKTQVLELNLRCWVLNQIRRAPDVKFLI